MTATRRPAFSKMLVGLERRLIPFGIEDVGAKEGEGQGVDDFLDPLGAKVHSQWLVIASTPKCVHHVDHVLTLGQVAGHRPVPGVAAIQKDRLGPRGADRLDHGGHPVHPAHPAIGPAQRGEILVGQGIGLGAGRGDVEHLLERPAHHMRRLALCLADADVPFGFAEPDRLQLGMDVGDVDQGQVAEIVELQQAGPASAPAGRPAATSCRKPDRP
jgi:hypothetical protein